VARLKRLYRLLSKKTHPEDLLTKLYRYALKFFGSESEQISLNQARLLQNLADWLGEEAGKPKVPII
jgi:hypothetical protein